MPHAGAIHTLLDRQFMPEKVAVECTYLAVPVVRGFKRPCSWAWLLKLTHQLPCGRATLGGEDFQSPAACAKAGV